MQTDRLDDFIRVLERLLVLRVIFELLHDSRQTLKTTAHNQTLT